MNRVEVETDYIEFCFENCECIKVDLWAIKYFNFDVEGEAWSYNPNHMEFLKTTKCKNVSIVFDITKPKLFSHTSRLVDDNKTVVQDGLDCIERLKTSDDISSFTINEVNYRVPWSEQTVNTDMGIPYHTNKWQTNQASINKQGIQTLSIKIMETENGSGEN